VTAYPGAKMEIRDAKELAKKASKEDLFNILCYNYPKFTEQELSFFKNEVGERGLEKEFADVMKAKEADDLNFKQTVLDASHDPLALLENFNAYTEGRFPDIAKRVSEDQIKKRKRKSLISVVLGVVLISIGITLTAAAEGSMIFYGAIVVGIILLAKGIRQLVQSNESS
jgi:hypothetical protein